ncbi:MAG: hypothetical protein ACAI38_22770 [Myxococcota bacterium]
MAPPPKPLTDEDSRVEALPTAAGSKAKRALGKMDDEASVSISQPSPLKKGTRNVPRGTVGFRAASQREAPPEKVLAARSDAEARVNAKKDERRQKVWDKLDAARKAADERLPRYTSFQPKRDK